MKKKDMIVTFWVILASHFLISVLLALAWGTSHPLYEIYKPGRVLPYVLFSCLYALPAYYVAGYLYILAKDILTNMDKVVGRMCLIFLAVLSGIFAVCFILFYFGISRRSWMYYVIMNYPSGVIYNTISLNVDGSNPLFVLSVLPCPLGFWLGALRRYRHEVFSYERSKK